MAKKILLIDGQIFQNNTWHRGMGQYVLHTLEQLDKLPTNREVRIIFNTNLPLEEDRLNHLKIICPTILQEKWPLPLPPQGKVLLSHEASYKAALNKYINKTVETSSELEYLITTPFTFDFFSLFPARAKKYLIFYDLAPLLHWKDLGGYFPPELYMKRFKQIFEADKIFAISETTKNDLLKTFALDKDHIVNIDGGYSGFEEEDKKPEFAVPQQYVLFPTADLPHKNNEVAVRGFNEFCKRTGWKGKLLITSAFRESSRLSLLAESNRIQFTGNVTVAELHWLYKNTSAVVFASKYEGLGIPLLDAVSNNKPAIASKIPVFLEMTKKGYYFFDPLDPSDLAASLESALTKNTFESMQPHYRAIMKKYTWEQTAKKLLTGLTSSSYATPTHKDLPRIAIATPHPGISPVTVGRLAEQLYVHLMNNYQIDFYFDSFGLHPQNMERPTFLDQLQNKVFDISRLNMNTFTKYEKILYLIDDDLGRVAQRAAIIPGFLVYKQTGSLESGIQQLIAENQSAVYDLENEYKPAEVTKIATWFAATTVSPLGRKKAKLLRSKRSRRSIMKQLMELSL